MKTLKRASVALIIPLLVGAYFKFRADAPVSPDPAKGTVAVTKEAPSQPLETTAADLSGAASAPKTAVSGSSNGKAEDKISHQELVAEYEALNDTDLKSTIAAVDKEMEDKRLIDKANRGEITEEERQELSILLKKFSALKEVETLRLLAAD
jgi:hypothetical protein